MNVSTQKSAKSKVINSPEYQEYLEYLEEERMAKNPDDFCFQTPSRNDYDVHAFDIFKTETEVSNSVAMLNEENFDMNYRITSAAI
ncbi:MAG: hypothetical protein B7C24_05240 [Bacteroidetes bacterium 4572_77]|nr:MAG: hypothetical protein B7C24_05240 [Bacteroidetes bacterium 4572_77]